MPRSENFSKRPAGLNWRSSTLFIVATITVSLFTDLFLYAMVVPILPFMLRDRVHLPESQVQGTVSTLLAVYAGASVLSSPVAGVLADKAATRRTPFMITLAILFLATVALFLGNTVTILALARIFQGISGAVVWTIGLALCLETVGPENLGKTIGTVFSFIGVGALVAPVVGGALYARAGYLGVALMGCSILVIDLVMRILMVEKKVAKLYEKNDVARTGEGRLPTEENSHGEQSDAAAGETGVPDESSPLITKLEDEHDYRISADQPFFVRGMPILTCFRNPRLAAAFWISFVQALLLGSLDATVPIRVQDLFNFDPLKSGLILGPLSVTDLIVGPLAGWSVDRYGVKPAAVFGCVFLVPVYALLRLPHAGGADQITLFASLIGLSGIGLAFLGGPPIVEAGAVVQKYHNANPEYFGQNGPYAQLYGLSGMVFSLGLTLGPIIGGGFKDLIGYGNMNAVLAGLSAFSAVLSFFYVGPPPRLSKKRTAD